MTEQRWRLCWKLYSFVKLLELDELVEETVLDVDGAELLDGLGDAVKRQEQADDTLDASKEH